MKPLNQSKNVKPNVKPIVNTAKMFHCISCTTTVSQTEPSKQNINYKQIGYNICLYTMHYNTFRMITIGQSESAQPHESAGVNVPEAH